MRRNKIKKLIIIAALVAALTGCGGKGREYVSGGIGNVLGGAAGGAIAGYIDGGGYVDRCIARHDGSEKWKKRCERILEEEYNPSARAQREFMYEKADKCGINEPDMSNECFRNAMKPNKPELG